jgi:hypothetical protein
MSPRLFSRKPMSIMPKEHSINLIREASTLAVVEKDRIPWTESERARREGRNCMGSKIRCSVPSKAGKICTEIKHNHSHGWNSHDDRQAKPDMAQHSNTVKAMAQHSSNHTRGTVLKYSQSHGTLLKHTRSRHNTHNEDRNCANASRQGRGCVARNAKHLEEPVTPIKRAHVLRQRRGVACRRWASTEQTLGRPLFPPSRTAPLDTTFMASWALWITITWLTSSGPIFE